MGIDIGKLEIKALLSNVKIEQTANEQLLYLKDLISRLSHEKTIFILCLHFTYKRLAYMVLVIGFPFTGKESYKGLDSSTWGHLYMHQQMVWLFFLVKKVGLGTLL